jgi:hypothetical protein
MEGTRSERERHGLTTTGATVFYGVTFHFVYSDKDSWWKFFPHIHRSETKFGRGPINVGSSAIGNTS